MQSSIKIFIVENKALLSGIAIIMVVLYHTGLRCFYPGFLGVDIFMFLSGFFLCYSFLHNSTSDFYLHRYKRILPIFIFLASIKSIIDYFSEPVSLWDYFCNITSLSYYNFGGSFVDWYLSSLLVLYLIFPILHRLFSSEYSLHILIFVLSSIFVLFLEFDIDWKYECAIGRMPIFCMGIIAFYEDSKLLSKSAIFSICSLILLFIAIYFYIKGSNLHTFYLLYLIFPIVFYCLCFGLTKVRFGMNLRKALEVLGKYSLEIYVANVFAMLFYQFVPNTNQIIRGLLILILTTLIVPICVLFNKCSQKIIKDI